MGYAMSSRNLEPCYNYELFTYQDESYKDKFNTDTLGNNIIFEQYFDTRKVYAVRVRCVGKKDTDASTDNTLSCDIGGTNETNVSFTDINEKSGTTYSPIAIKKKYALVKLYVTGGTDYQLFRNIHLIMLMNE